nr:retrotransposon protein, putative, Ty1-copia subclass [Tanacetum cinerariifolium]
MALNNAQTKTSSLGFRSMLEKRQLTGPNFNELFRALKLFVRTKKLQDVFATALPPAPAAGADAQALADWAVLFYRHNEVACLMLGTMYPKLYQQFEHNSPLKMVTELQKMYEKPPGVELQELKTISEVHSLLIEFEKSIKRNKQPIVGAFFTPQVMAIQGGKVQKYKPQGKAKGKGKGKGPQNSYPTKPKKPQPYKKERLAKDGQCHHYKEEGHWKRNCSVYLAELMKKKKKTEGQNVASTSSDYLKPYGIVQQLTPPYTPQHNGVSEKRNRTLLNMVRSMMSLATLPLSFWDYALESVARILNMVPTKKVDKTSYALWHGKVLNLSCLKVWGCEAHVKCHTLDKLQQRSVKCIFLGYPKETMGYYFYYPPENKIVVERYANFLKKDFILQKESGTIIELEDEDILPSENTSEHPIEEESLAPIVSQEENVIPVGRSVRTHKAPDRLCLNVEIDPDRLRFNVEVEEHKIDPDRLRFNVEVEEHSLGDLNEPANYKSSLSDPEFEKWLVAMNAKIQSMYDNKVWRLVVLPPNAKVVKSKWIYKKKTDMDGKVHIYKARLVSKACTQTYGVDYEEIFLHVDDIRVIRILIAIAVYYDYEICLQEVKTYLGKCFSLKDLREAVFILGIKVYRDRSRRLIGLSQNAYLDKILKRYRMDNSKRGSIPMQVDLHLSKSQCATTSAEMKRMQNVPYALAVGSIMYAVRNTKDTFLVYGGDPEAKLRVNCYCGAGFETDRDDTKSQSGYVFVLNGGAVVWKSSKQITIAQHATEAEYIAASEAGKEVVWIRKFIDELGVVPSNDYPIKMNCDNSATIIMAKESGFRKAPGTLKENIIMFVSALKLAKLILSKFI